MALNALGAFFHNTPWAALLHCIFNVLYSGLPLSLQFFSVQLSGEIPQKILSKYMRFRSFCQVSGCHCSGKQKPININILGGTVSGTNWNRSLGQLGTRPWVKPAV